MKVLFLSNHPDAGAAAEEWAGRHPALLAEDGGGDSRTAQQMHTYVVGAWASHVQADDAVERASAYRDTVIPAKFRDAPRVGTAVLARSGRADAADRIRALLDGILLTSGGRADPGLRDYVEGETMQALAAMHG